MTFGPASIAALQPAIRRALPEWGLAPASEVTLLSLSENATFLVTPPGFCRAPSPSPPRKRGPMLTECSWMPAFAGMTGSNELITERPLVLRVHRPGYHSLDEIRSELAWIAALRAEAGILAPAPVAGSDGALIRPLRVGIGPELPAVAFEYVAGAEPAPRAETFRTLGGITARLHRHARGWQRPAGFVRQTWNYDTTLGEHALWGEWRNGPGLDRTAIALLERTADCLRLRLARFGTAPDRFGLIHADLRLANLLSDGADLHVIDFDDCGFGWFAYDFAAAVSFFEDHPAVPALLAAWLDGYRASAPLARADEAEIPAFIMLRRMLLLAWIGSHPEATTARELAPTYAAGTAALAEDFLSRYGAGSTGRAYFAKDRARIS